MNQQNLSQEQGFLTTHVLDTALGKPAEGLEITLSRLDGNDRVVLATMITNEDGRTDSPILPKQDFVTGTYELLFMAGDYLQRLGVDPGSPRFLDEIPIRFGIDDATSHYHVPLLLSPFGYSTYRGS